MQFRARLIVILGVLLTLGILPLLASGQTGPHVFGTPEFLHVWERTDLPVEQGHESRTWIWGPGAITPLLEESYVEGNGGARQVQYTDKSRMEMPVHPVDPDSDWFITQGLLATELMTGELQLGDATFDQHPPADIPVAGDPVNNLSPTYAAMGQLINEPARPANGVISETLTQNGAVSDDPSLTSHNVTDAYYISQTDHNIASVFWDFMNSTGVIYEGDQFVNGAVFPNPFYAIGYPITEAYWGNVTVAEQPQEVLMQCFERRCLTYAPGNPVGWEVESGNIGQHYRDWRYDMFDQPDPMRALLLAQTEDLNIAGATHEFTATLSENGDDLDIGDEEDVIVSIDRDGSDVDPIDDLDVSLTGNVATISYTGPDDSAVDTIDVSVNVEGEVVVGEPSLTVTWQGGDVVYQCDVIVPNGETIQSAIDAASSGDVICVASGAYQEDLQVDKSLTLLGAQVDVDARERSATDESEIIGSVDVASSVSDFTINGFTLTGTGVNRLAGVNLYIASNESTVSNNVVYTVEATDGYTNSGFFSFESIDNATIQQNSFTGALDLTRGQNVIAVNGASGTLTIEANDMEHVGGGGGVALVGDIGAASILDNFIDNTGKDGMFHVGGTLSTLVITGNTVTNNDETGIKLVAGATTSDISSNNIFGNTVFGVRNQSGSNVNAINNWWGDNSGPTHASNPSGTGDNVSDDVDFDPWKDDGPF